MNLLHLLITIGLTTFMTAFAEYDDPNHPIYKDHAGSAYRCEMMHATAKNCPLIIDSAYLLECITSEERDILLAQNRAPGCVFTDQGWVFSYTCACR